LSTGDPWIFVDCEARGTSAVTRDPDRVRCRALRYPGHLPRDFVRVLPGSGEPGRPCPRRTGCFGPGAVIIHTGCGHSFDPQIHPQMQQRIVQFTWAAAIALLMPADPGTLYGASYCPECLAYLVLVRTGDERIVYAPTQGQYLAGLDEKQDADGLPADY
jgi:hypothetical protein